MTVGTICVLGALVATFLFTTVVFADELPKSVLIVRDIVTSVVSLGGVALLLSALFGIIGGGDTMLNFILGFLIGVIAEFVTLLVIAKQVQKRRDKSILINGNGNNVKYEISRGDENVNQSMGKR